ncbi:glycoside hydrolase family 19 protein [Paraburkholderia phenoliruptrix]|uniref:Chitinase-like protein n=2 Tax=Paraburkholderia phenoliruptrix TaxID=252970 RepID=K0DPG5_9BURK|nr:glycoside hydrolase family 19 protein [Paraburkholderia phenoliruptrix]AFT85319.1 chitinase-like protein [Paraburkholderia phenoliruptrix BR3459a]MDR6421409.1 putative chitinase [Paraburkholderia phenoliruptrix]CAB4047829.1 hypothetical protein LMG9964_01463 [Paraburkholderia phenoliruptrix]
MANSSPLNAGPTPLKQIAFAFPFRKKGQGNGALATDITDEHDMYPLLKQEPTGSFPVSASGMWHGGIHISEAGAGQGLDLKGGVRCIADGEVIAWRVNRKYLASTLPSQNGGPEINAQYSTGFALVQHSMEFPLGKKWTFFSLYMHLQDYASYEADPALPWPGYWSAKYQVTEDTVDKPTASASGQAPSVDQTGLRVRVNRPHGATVGILPRGTLVSLSKREGDWGQIAEDPGALIAPAVGGYVASSAAIGKWIFLGKEHGHPSPVVEKVMPDSVFDCVNVIPQPEQRLKVKAGDVLGYLGRYDSLRDQTSNRVVHIEVFSDDSIKQFIIDGRAGVNANITTPANWSQLGLSATPTILRIAAGTTLYDKDPVAGTPPQASAQAKKTDVIQVETFAVLQNHAGNSFLETSPGNDGQKRHWWKVDSVDMQRNAISGWVREQSFAGGTVTQEHSQSWIDFECHDQDHDPTHTIFASTADYVAYTKASDDPTAGGIGKLSPLMTAIYRALYPYGDGAHAAEELRSTGQNPQGSSFPWVAFRASRLVPKHESEWANPSKWQELVSAIEQSNEPEPQHEEEKKRIAKLVWWDEVQAGVPGFPGPDVFHIHPIAMAGNFASKKLVCKKCGTVITLTKSFMSKIAPGANVGVADELIRASTDLFKKYGVNSCRQIKHLLAQAKVETTRFTSFRESLNYVSYTGQSLYNMAPTAINNGFARKNMTFPTPAAKIAWIQNHLIANDPAYGEHCFGVNVQPGKDFRGRGLLQLTFYETYKRCGDAIGYPIDSQPELVESNPRVIIETGLWFWANYGIGSIADNPSTIGDDGVKKVTYPINSGYKALSERQRFHREISIIFNQEFSSGCTDD